MKTRYQRRETHTLTGNFSCPKHSLTNSVWVSTFRIFMIRTTAASICSRETRRIQFSSTKYPTSLKPVENSEIIIWTEWSIHQELSRQGLPKFSTCNRNIITIPGRFLTSVCHHKLNVKLIMFVANGKMPNMLSCGCSRKAQRQETQRRSRKLVIPGTAGPEIPSQLCWCFPLAANKHTQWECIQVRSQPTMTSVLDHNCRYGETEVVRKTEKGKCWGTHRLFHLDLINLDAEKLVHELSIEVEHVTIVHIFALQCIRHRSTHEWTVEQTKTTIEVVRHHSMYN